jgi:tRNA threonylcarbamoyladenosine biosynthesis protein TsaB
MIVLGLDTATTATAVALRAGGKAAGELRDDPAPGAHPGHATRLLALAAELLASAGVRWGEVNRIAAGVGPGAFTGLRVGLATARGLAQALDAELVGVSSLAALAAGALGGEAQVPERVLAVIDARRGEVFAAAYSRGPGGWPVAQETPRAVAPFALARLAGVAGLAAVGDGAVRYRGELEAGGVTVAPDDSPLHLIRAAAICERGAAVAPPAARHEVVPDYLRRPDAELALEGTG